MKMISPPLGTSGEGFGGGTLLDTNGNGRTGTGETKSLPKKSSVDPSKLSVDVMSGITAQWHGADEAKVTGDVEGLGSDGKFNWVCSNAIQAEETIQLLLRWKVTVPASTKTDIADLTEPLVNVRS